MPEKILMPKLGMTMETGTVTKWYKKEGDVVAKGEAIVEVLTDKANMDVEAPVSGTLYKILATEGEEIAVNGLIGIIQLEGESDGDIKKLLDIKEIKEQPAEEKKQEVEVKKNIQEENYIPSTPYAKQLAKGKGISLEELPKNESGVVSSKSVATLNAEDIVGLSTITKAMADKMVESNKIPQFTLYYDVVAETLLQVNETCKKLGYRSSLTAIIVKVVSELFRDFPLFKYKFDGEKLINNGHHNIGIAVETERGLFVPVIKNVESLDTKSLFDNFNTIIEKTINNALTLSDFEGGSLTISNLGMFGVDLFRALLVPGQVAILAVSAIVEKPVIINGGMFIKKVFNVSISCDHRVIDGATAAKFMQAFKKLTEEKIDEVIKCQ